MKKILIILLMTSLIGLEGFAQPTCDIAIENPRIDGTTYKFDVYFKRTNSWTLDYFGSCSWYFNWNTPVVISTPTLTYVNPVYIPATSYTNVVGDIGGQLRIATNYSAGLPATTLPLDTWIHVYTISSIINSVGQCGVSWDPVNTGILNFMNTSATETYFDSGTDILTDTKSWTGATDCDWDVAGNWSPAGVPLATDDIIYPNNPTTELTSASVNPFVVVNNLRVNHDAELTIPAGFGVTVSGNTELKGDKNIIIESVGSATASFIPTGPINYNSYTLEAGEIEVQRDLDYVGTSPTNFYQHYVASPVSGVILEDWNMIDEHSWAYDFRPLEATQWFNLVPESTPMDPGHGFTLSVDNGTSLEKVKFYNNLVLGSVPVAVVADNWNLIGNPYTAAVDWELMKVQGGFVDGVVIWNPATSNYESWIVTFPLPETADGANLSCRYIQPGQSFFIEAITGTTTFTFNPSDRLHANQPFLKDDVTNVLSITTEGGNGTSDGTMIRFLDGELTGGYDQNFDMYDWPSQYGDVVTEIYTVGTDNSYFNKDARPLIEDEQIDIPLHFKAGVEATYALNFDMIETFEEDYQIFLEDTYVSQPWQNLRELDSYSFMATTDDEYNRFVIHFYKSSYGIDDKFIDPVSIYSYKTEAVIVNNTEQYIKEILIYDMMGNLIVNKATVNASPMKIYVSDKVGYYAVKVITDKAVYTEKIFISR